ncbi:hypothetical protein CTAYLR_004846 [Chrysophaeum taylorii]|uniref:Sulfotransferase domain-containing protein n=1 Tax=Chrysophaeum taylorii TaxID=2483200 RepID=A0AAD7XKY5_9STRA|nr:hypothetical protein CTAYLR_004846 [Chrysophaeum taylorii]
MMARRLVASLAAAAAAWVAAGLEGEVKNACRRPFQHAGLEELTVVHFHIPKTGGSALEKMLFMPLSKLRNWSTFHDNDNAERVFDALRSEERSKLDFLSGHQHIGLDSALGGRQAMYVCMLRHPVDRMVSLYRYVRGSRTHHRHALALNQSFAEFMASAASETSNWVTKALCAPRDQRIPTWSKELTHRCHHNASFAVAQATANLESRFGAVGLLEEYDTSVRMIARCLNAAELGAVAATRGPYGASRAPPYNVETNDVELVRRTNALDVRVFEFGRELFRRHAAQLQHAAVEEALLRFGTAIGQPKYPRLRARPMATASKPRCDFSELSPNRRRRRLSYSASSVLDGSTPRLLESYAVVMGPDVVDDVVQVRGSARKVRHAGGKIMSARGIASNRGLLEYRILEVEVRIDYESALLETGEAVESDLCLVILDDTLVNSVSSGSEVMCVHEHFVKGSANPEPSRWQFECGLPFPPGYRFEMGSVSSVWSTEGEIVVPEELETRRRAVDPREVWDIFGLGISYEVRLARSDRLVDCPPVSSVRSPFRDRSRPSQPGFASPSTPFVNVERERPVAMRAMGLFVSVLRPGTLDAHVVELRIDGEVARSFCLPPNRVDATTPSVATFASLDGIEIPPGGTVEVVHLNAGTNQVLLDFAAYLFTDASPTSLVRKETSLFEGTIDLNGDGFADYVDVDAAGVVYFDLTRDGGGHDTQHVLIHAEMPPRMRAALDPRGWSLVGREGPDHPYVRLDAHPYCHVFEKRRSTGFPGFQLNTRYCDESKVPPSGDCTTDCDHTHLRSDAGRTHAYGDLDGDGFLDRVRATTVDNGDLDFFVAKGTPEGSLDREILWFSSTCCRGVEPHMTFEHRTSMFMRTPVGSRKSVLLATLNFCPEKEKMNHQYHRQEEGEEPWCRSEEEARQWRFEFVAPTAS